MKGKERVDDLIVLYKDMSYEIIPEKEYHYQKNQKYVIIPHTIMNIGGGILLKPTEFWDFDEVELTMELCARNYDFDDMPVPDKKDKSWVRNPELYENLSSSEQVLSRTTDTYSSIIDVMNALHSIDKLRYVSNLYNETDDNGYLYTTIEITYAKIVVKKEKKIILELDEGSPLLYNLGKRVIDTNRIRRAIKPFYNPAKLGDDFVFKMKNNQWDYDLMMKTTHRMSDMKGYAYLWYLRNTSLCYPLMNIEYLNMRKDIHEVQMEMLVDVEYHRLPKEMTEEAWRRLEETESYWSCAIISLNDAAAVFEFSRYVNYFLLTMQILFDDFVFDSDSSAKKVYIPCKVETRHDAGWCFAFDYRNINPDDFWWNFVYDFLDGVPFK